MWGCFRLRIKDTSSVENGGQVLDEPITLRDTFRIFSQKELQKVTDNYARDRMLHRDGFYSVYKGILDDDFIIAVKVMSNCTVHHQDYCFNEIAITSHMNHKNVLKLLGCCLERQVPVQVYEFCSNGLLSQHIYENFGTSTSQLLPWHSRLRIAIEIADAITYLHNANPKCIVHRNIKPSNILLDQNYVAKLSDFCLSVSIPIGQTQVQTEVLAGTCGYMAPEYFMTHQVTEKNDVYSFGMLLLELLTGLSCNHSRSLADGLMQPDYIISLIENDHLSDIIAPTISSEGVIEQQLLAFTELALRCREMNVENRPVMIEVAEELRWIKRSFEP